MRKQLINSLSRRILPRHRHSEVFFSLRDGRFFRLVDGTRPMSDQPAPFSNPLDRSEIEKSYRLRKFTNTLNSPGSKHSLFHDEEIVATVRLLPVPINPDGTRPPEDPDGFTAWTDSHPGISFDKSSAHYAQFYRGTPR